MFGSGGASGGEGRAQQCLEPRQAQCVLVCVCYGQPWLCNARIKGKVTLAVQLITHTGTEGEDGGTHTQTLK